MRVWWLSILPLTEMDINRTFSVLCGKEFPQMVRATLVRVALTTLFQKYKCPSMPFKNSS